MADFTNIDGVYAKDTELRSGINTLRTTVLSNTIKPLTVTKNDTYTAIPSSGTYGYSPIIVDVQEEPWEPLQDGYSNFWFELTNDTLSPWLNFSAKNANATIDWGDGTGEQSLDTLTPTHTYSKAGKYVVKVKGVTGIGAQHSSQLENDYFDVLKYIELNNEVVSYAQNAFSYCTGLLSANINTVTYANLMFRYCGSLKSVTANSATGNIGTAAFQYCFRLGNFTMTSNATNLGASSFSFIFTLKEITIPSTVTNIENYVFSSSTGLATIHMLPTSPPTLGGTSVFSSLLPNYIIYVPVGYGETYKSAAGWSDYADHIVEEGQTLSNAALRRIQAEKNDDIEEMR